MIEKIIIENCDFKQRTLLRAAQIGRDAPDTGVEIKNKSAYHVIKDCADITCRYLAMYAWSWYDDPIKKLKKKVKKNDLKDLVTRALDPKNEQKRSTRQLLTIILISLDEAISKDKTKENPEEIKPLSDSDDIYGDYDYGDPISDEEWGGHVGIDYNNNDPDYILDILYHWLD
jgi:hypothetical protein